MQRTVRLCVWVACLAIVSGDALRAQDEAPAADDSRYAPVIGRLEASLAQLKELEERETSR